MARFGEREREREREREKEIAKEKFYAAKTPIKIWDVNVDNIATSKLVKIKTNLSIWLNI